MSLPALSDWTDTRTGLHQAAQVIGAVRATVALPKPNYTHLGLRVVRQGLTTGALPTIGELLLDFTTLTILYTPPEKEPVGFSLFQHYQISLADAVEHALVSYGHDLKLNRDKITGEMVFNIDPKAAADYAQVLFLLSETFNRFRASLHGEKSPVIVWPHGFDLSFLWFATTTATEEAPHMSFGFSPYSAGLERPYLYTYPYPRPESLTTLPLPKLTRWHTEGWVGTVTSLDELTTEDDPATVIETLLRDIHAAVSPLLRQ